MFSASVVSAQTADKPRLSKLDFDSADRAKQLQSEKANILSKIIGTPEPRAALSADATSAISYLETEEEILNNPFLIPVLVGNPYTDKES
mgnify:FL=1